MDESDARHDATSDDPHERSTTVYMVRNVSAPTPHHQLRIIHPQDCRKPNAPPLYPSPTQTETHTLPED
eukprot:4526836-Prymnesium_polylepis.1